MYKSQWLIVDYWLCFYYNLNKKSFDTMVTNIFSFISVFIFIMSVLYCIRTLFRFGMVVYRKEGKLDNEWYDNLLLGLSVSYIISTLIVGF